MTLIIVACSKSKATIAQSARSLYVSPLFRAAWRWAELAQQPTVILSAEHGVLDPDTVVEPYDTYLGDLTIERRLELIDKVRLQLAGRGSERIVVLGGQHYVDLVRAALPDVLVADPLRGLNIGNRIRWLGLSAGPGWERFLALEGLYGELRRLAGGDLKPSSIPTLTEVLRGQIPNRGVYFFFEEGELRRGRSELRVTRVGTHAVSRGAASNLRGRLRTHAGTEALTGSHRSSIFRLHVGSALLLRDSIPLPTWGTGSGGMATAEVRADETPTEIMVSARLRNMRALVLSVPDEPSAQSDRAFVERNSIGLLSSVGRLVDPASLNWLGNQSARDEIRESGLWNLDHLKFQPRPDFLAVLEALVTEAGGNPNSLAPQGWWNRDQSLF